MKKSRLLIAVLSVMIFTSCEKEEEDMSSNIFLNDTLTETWDAERTPIIKEKVTSTSNRYGTANGLVDEIKEGDQVIFGTDSKKPNNNQLNSNQTANGLVDEIIEDDQVIFRTNSKEPNNNQLRYGTYSKQGSGRTVKFFNNH